MDFWPKLVKIGIPITSFIGFYTSFTDIQAVINIMQKTFSFCQDDSSGVLLTMEVGIRKRAWQRA